MAAFRLPSACIRDIGKLCSAFLWSRNELNARKAKVAWAEITRPIDEGGLGLRCLRESNKVSCLRLLWRLVTRQPSLWVTWMYNNLIKGESIWTVNGKKNAGSWMWRKILKYRDMARTMVKVEVRNGQTTSFWYDNWSTKGCLMDII